ncbi:MAG: hypothetical protein Q8N43_03465, partial [Candidatus Azambacteria bacterium]|nr:hypothetical protein [Candidatus Azambacteria bacterium]
MTKSKIFLLLLLSFIGGVFLCSLIKIQPVHTGGILIIEHKNTPPIKLSKRSKKILLFVIRVFFSSQKCR